MPYKIYKYEVKPQANFTIDLPSIHQILCVQTQHNIPFIWVEVDTDSEIQPIKLSTIATGEEYEDDGDNMIRDYIGTFQLNNGTSVFHLFQNYSFE